MELQYFFLVLTMMYCGTLATVNYRLPHRAQPTAYNLDLNIDPEKSTYTGSVSIDLNIESSSGEPNNTLKLNSGYKYINITAVSINGKEGDCNISFENNITDIATITCKNSIVGSNQILKLDFTAVLASDDMVGFYKSTYTEENKNKTLAATQFETSYARRAFPCFDEPTFKSKFTISVTSPKKYTVWSNAVVDHQSNFDDGDTITTVFKPTPKMSTYLVALMISEFKASENNDKPRDYSYSVISRASAKDYTTLAVKYGPILIDLMGNWTMIPYASLGNPKQDLTAIPDFAAGAMENWGLITYKEETLLDEGDKTSNLDRQTVITVIAHELAHQWFGDYVTMHWWSEVWLNEGFATYFEYHNANNVNESLELDYQFVISEHQVALKVDSVVSALSLSSKDDDINNVAEQTKKFDGISYEKGGSIVRMIKYILGEDEFRQALNQYLVTNQYNNSKASILLKSFEEVAPEFDGKRFSEYISPWIYKPGFPLLKASIDKSGVVTVENKRRYLLAGENISEWYVPLTFTTSDNINFTNNQIKWLHPNTSASINLTNKDDWIIFNLQSSGFYRVNYDTELWSRISSVLNQNFKEIHVLNRALLIDDIFNIAKIGEIDYNTTFNLVEYIGRETEYYPWYSFLSEVDYLLGKIKNENTKKKLVNNTLTWLSSIIEIPSSNSHENLTHIKVLQRSLILNWACKLGHEECIKYATSELTKYKNKREEIDHNLRRLIFCYGFKSSKSQSTDFEFLLNIYKASNSPYEKNDVLSALSCSTDTQILEKYLQMSIAEDSPIRFQDSIKVFNRVYTFSSDGLSIALNFMDKNMDGILKRYKGIATINTLLVGIANYVVKEDDYKKLQKIISDNQNVEEVVVSGKEALERATANKKWSDEREKDLTSALLYNGNPVPDSAAGNYLSAVCLLVISIALFVF